MANQPRLEAYEPAEFFDDGVSVRPPVEGTIPRGESVHPTVEETGRVDGELVSLIPVEVTPELLERGRDRFGIYCSNCHGPAGYGDGLVVQRGFPAPPSYHGDRLRDVADGHVFDVITNGTGRMPAFGRRIEPYDRWAIVAYVRALQLSQFAVVDELTESDRQALNHTAESENE